MLTPVNSNVMYKILRIIVNCIITAILSIGAIWVMVLVESALSTKGFMAARFFSERVSLENLSLVLGVFDVIRFAIFAALSAFLMLWLKPRRVAIYSFVSATTLVVFLQLPAVLRVGNTFAILLTTAWVITIPLLYWFFCRIVENRQNKSFNRTQESSAARYRTTAGGRAGEK